MRMVVYIESSLHLCASACRCVHENIQYPLFTVQPYGIWISHHMNDMGLCMLSTGQFGDHRRVRVGVYAVNLITLLIIWMIWITNVCVHAVNQPIRRPTVERERERAHLSAGPFYEWLERPMCALMVNLLMVPSYEEFGRPGVCVWAT